MNLCTCEKPIIRNDRCMKCCKFRFEDDIAAHYPVNRDDLKADLCKIYEKEGLKIE
jgi:hypothetical protein